MQTPWTAAAAATLTCAMVIGSPAAAQSPIMAAPVVASGFDQPLAVTSPPGDTTRLFVAERTGRVRIIDTDTWTVKATPFLDLTAAIPAANDSDGLLGLAFDPAYATNGRVYVYYIGAGNAGVIARYTVTNNPDVAGPTGEIIWRAARPVGNYGGWLAFSPTDGMLYWASGDGGTTFSIDPQNHAQDITGQVLGKIMRIDPSGDDFPADPDRNYRIPAGNPFVGTTGDDEIWAYGLRNPWRASFDRQTGDLWIGDVGHHSFEEIDFQPAGAAGLNYGWRCMEGAACTGAGGCTCNAPSLAMPIHAYDHITGKSVTGGYVYRGSAIPALRGAYLYADFITGRAWSFVRSGGGAVTQLTERTADLVPAGSAPGATIPGIASFGEDAAGELYFCNLFTGSVHKIVAPGCAVAITQPPASASVADGGTVELSVSAGGSGTLRYRWQRNGLDLADGGPISGSATPTLRIQPAHPSDSGAYTVRVWNACGPVVSPAAAVQVSCRADADHNGRFEPADVATFVNTWFSNLNGGGPGGDFDGNGSVEPADVAAFVGEWHQRVTAGGC